MGHKKNSRASNVENEGSDESIRNECRRALNIASRGNHTRALKLLKEMSRRHESSAIVHRMQGSIHAMLAALVDDTNVRERHRKNAAACGRKAIALSPNSIEYALFYGSTLWELANDSEKYNEVVVECERALSIQCPSDPAKDNLDLDKEMIIRASTPEERIRFVHEGLEDLLEDAKTEISYLMDNLEPDGSEDCSEDTSDKSSIAQREEQPVEVKLDKNLSSNDVNKCFDVSTKYWGSWKKIPAKQENQIRKRRKNAKMKKFSSLVDMLTQVRPLWDSLTIDKKRELLKVRISDFKNHFISGKNALAVNVLSEAIAFAKENNTWRFWKCCVCDEKFSHFTILKEHLLNEHKGFPEKLSALFPEQVETALNGIGNGSWKPVDISAAITLMENQSKQQPSDDIDRDTSQAQKWPLSDDSERTQVLVRVHCLFSLLLKRKCLAKSHLNRVLEYATAELQLIVPSPQIMSYGLNQMPLCICFLGTTQLTWIAEFLQYLADSCRLQEESEEMSTKDHNIGGTEKITVKERLSLADDSSCLLLDDRFLKGTLNPSTYDTALAHDGSTLPPADDDDQEEEVPPDNDALLNWIYSGTVIEEQLSIWTHLTEKRKNQARKYFRTLATEFNLLQVLCDIKYGHMSYNEALEEVERMLKGKVNMGIDSILGRQSYMSLLRKIQEYVKSEKDANTISGGSKFVLRAIMKVLKEAQALRDSTKYEEEDVRKVGEYLDEEDNCVEVAINRLKDEHVLEVLKTDAQILRSVNYAHQLIQKFGPVSLHDFRTVIVALLRSFLQAHLKNMADKAATEKCDATREAFLAEIECEAKNKADPPKQKQEMPKHKKKKKDRKKGKDSKAKGGDSDQPQLPPKFVHKALLPHVIYVGDFAVIGADIDGDLKRQEDEVTRKHELEEEERKLEATLQYQKQIEEEAKQKLSTRQSQKVSYGTDDEKMELGRNFRERSYMMLNSGVDQTPLSNRELLTGMDELTKDLSGLTAECKGVTGIERSKKGRRRSRGKKGLLHRSIVENSSVKLLDKSFGTMSSEKEKLDTGSLQMEGFTNDEFLDQDAVRSSNRVIEAQRDFHIPIEQKELQKLCLQEDSRAKDKIEAYAFGMGLQNNVGEYNCFLNVIIQSLWHLQEFRDQFLSRSTSVHVHIGDPCVVCSLYDILMTLSISSLLNVQREAVAPTSLRIALSKLYPDSNFFQEMNDASEVLAVIFDCLHQSFTVHSAVSHCLSEESKCTGSWDCTNNTCIAHTLFGMDIYQKLECSNCGIQTRFLKYTSFIHNINASALRSMKIMHANSSFDELLHLVEMEEGLTCDPEAEGCGKINHIRRILATPPHVFTIGNLEEMFRVFAFYKESSKILYGALAEHRFLQICLDIEVLGWQTTCESLADISATLSALTTEIDIGTLYQGLGPGNRYCLSSVVCYCGHHYYCFAYNHEHHRWIMFDDKTVKVIGFWVDVLTICERGLLQPQILFFEAIK